MYAFTVDFYYSIHIYMHVSTIDIGRESFSPYYKLCYSKLSLL